MGKNKKNRNNNRGNNNIVPTTKVVTDLSAEQIEKIEKFAAEDMPQEVEAIPESEILDTDEDAEKVEDVKRTGNVDRYIDFLHTKFQKIKTAENKAESLKARYIDSLEKLNVDKADFESKKKDSEEQKRTWEKELNDRQKRLDEQQGAIDRGEYSTVIKDVLESLRKTEVEITDSTKKLVEEMGQKHSLYVESLSQLSQKEEQIEAQLQEIESTKAELARDRKRMEMNKASFEKRVKQDMEDEFNDKIEDLEFENSSLKRKNTQMEKEVKSANDFKRQLMSSFQSVDAENMLKEQELLKEKCSMLEKELDSRHSNSEYDMQVQAVDDLKSKVKELEEHISEERLSELRLSLHNADAYILEINTYKAQIDSAQAREKSLTRTVQDLHDTIKRLKDEEKVKEAAFEQARRMDSDIELQNRKLRNCPPYSLTQLVEYLQKYMATSRDPKPFFYEQKTIRTFLAGLNMSPLSILQGISGTGKTSLPREIAKALVAGADGYTGKDDAGNRKEPYRICAIQSGWRDNMDLIGFYNNFEKKYKETDFFKAIYRAAQPKYKDTLFLIILDEMNLSHPEHYFADFLSMMEQGVCDRYVKIHADEELLPKLFKQGQMQLPPNVRFIGTANHDETTLDFAPKTYDRSNVMVMSNNNKEEVKEEISLSTGNSSTRERLSVSYSWLADKFMDAEDEYLSRYEEFDTFLKKDKLVEHLKQLGIGIGNRFDEQAKKFICAYMALGSNSSACLAEAADHLITSRLFRSIRNRYDIRRDTLETFRKFYEEEFKKTFSHEPTEGKILFNEELSKK